VAAPLRAEQTRATSGWRVFSDGARRQRALVALALIAAAGLVLAAEVPVCPTALFFGVPCPGCGLTRATLALFRGDLREAFALHPLAPILGPLFLGALGKVLFDFVRGPTPKAARPSFWTKPAGTLVAVLLLVAVVGVWLARFAGHLGGPVPVQTLHSLTHPNH
jgi:glucan phosphoethanolaminetransferase (alkaline phosphatase superfamily)